MIHDVLLFLKHLVKGRDLAVRGDHNNTVIDLQTVVTGGDDALGAPDDARDQEARTHL